MSEKKKWISGNDLLKRWGIMDFELLDYLKKGLRPFERYRNLPIVCPKKYHLYHRYNGEYPEVLTALNTIKDKFESGKGIEVHLNELHIRNKTKVFFRVLYCSFLFDIPKTNFKKIKEFLNIGSSSGDQFVRSPVFVDNYKVIELFLKIIEKTAADLQSKIENIKSDDPNCFSWKYFVKPYTETVVIKLCNKITNAVFKLEDVEKFEKKFGINTKPKTQKKLPEELSSQYVFRKTGPTWTIVYKGKELNGLKGKGFQFIHYLVLHERKGFYTNDLAKEVEKVHPDMLREFSRLQEVGSDSNNIKGKNHIDHRSMIDDKYEKDLKEQRDYLAQELRKAENDNDLPRIQKFRAKYEELGTYLHQLIRPNGKPRKFGDSTTRTKERITKAIKRALQEINDHDENTWRHFNSALSPIHSYKLSYTPDRHIDWLTK